MRSIANNKEWSLIHNDNGEWISEEYAVSYTEPEAKLLQIQATKLGRKLSFQRGADGILWCYKHEIEQIKTKYYNEQKTTKCDNWELHPKR
jgi:hypothetical protein